ncbi:9372_t:CDS:2, partial [Dentiscutata erythropus]
MINVVEAIDFRMQKEALNASFIIWKYKSLIYHQLFIIERLFSNIEELIQKHLSYRIIEELKNQMCESVLYQCKKIEIGSTIEFNEDQLKQIVNQKEYNGKFNENQTAVEDYYDFQQTYLKALMNSVSNNTIKEVWQIIPYMAPNSYQHIILLDDNMHLCTCLLLVSCSIICRHYFKLMVENPSALFHVMLMPTRWFQNDSWEHLDLISKEPFIGLSSPKSQDKNIQQIVPKHFNNIQETDNDQKNLNEFILSYIARKEKKQESEAQSVIIEDQTLNNDNIVRLVDGHIYDADDIQDPIAHQSKGRPATKCLKAFTEENNKASTSNTKHANSSNREKGIEVSS